MDRRALLIGAGLTALAGVSYLRAPKAGIKPLAESEFRAAIPTVVGAWRSRPSAELVLPPQDDSNKLYENLETRIYEGDGLPAMMVLVAYSTIQQNDIQVHRPEVCYPASGYPIIGNRPTTLQFGSKLVNVTELTADRGGLMERIIYWVRVGDDFPLRWAEQRLSMAMANLRGGAPDGVLFRVSALEGPGDDVSLAIRRFIGLFVDQASPTMRDKILF